MRSAILLVLAPLTPALIFHLHRPKQVLHTRYMEDDRPSAAQVDTEEAEEDALPDWSRFASFAK